MKTTFDKQPINSDTHVYLPIITYQDKTGTDSYQRYPLEPCLFSVANLTYQDRQNRRSWRHLGFLPSTGQTNDPVKTLQLYHDCLVSILCDLKYYQQHPPKINI